MATKAALSMDDLLIEMPPQPLEPGEVVEAKVISAAKNEVWLDLGTFGAGLVARREISPGLNLKVGDTVSASVLEAESELGFPVLSLKKVAKEQGWDRLSQIFDNGEIIDVYAYDANRGGLLVEVEGIRGFLPVSQLTAEHYPRVSGADKDEILHRLHSLVKQPMRVRILDLDREQSKLILSEKEAVREDTKQKLSLVKVGDVIEGAVTGCVDFGIFVTVEGIEGLVHISEIAWERVTNPAERFKVGDKVKAKVIAIDNEKLSLSIKQLSEDPWLREIKKFKPGDTVKGTITRITPFGAFVQLTPAIEALVHVSELGQDEGTEIGEQLKVSQVAEFKILEVDDQARRISLTAKAGQGPLPKAAPKPATKSVAKVSRSATKKPEPTELAK